MVNVAGPFKVAEAVHSGVEEVLVTLWAFEPLGHVQIMESPGLMVVVAGTKPVGVLLTVTFATAPWLWNGRARASTAVVVSKMFLSECIYTL